MRVCHNFWHLEQCVTFEIYFFCSCCRVCHLLVLDVSFPSDAMITTVVATQLRQIIGSDTDILISCVSLCSLYFTASLVRVFRSPLITRLLLGLARLTSKVMSYDSYAVWSPCLTVRIILALGSTDSIHGSTDNSLGSTVNRRRSSVQGASKRLVTPLFQATAKTSKG